MFDSENYSTSGGIQNIKRHFGSQIYWYWQNPFEGLVFPQLLKIFPAFYGSQNLIQPSEEPFTFCYAELSTSVQVTLSQPTCFTSCLILSSHLRLGFSSCLFLQVFLENPCIGSNEFQPGIWYRPFSVIFTMNLHTL